MSFLEILTKSIATFEEDTKCLKENYPEAYRRYVFDSMTKKEANQYLTQRHAETGQILVLSKDLSDESLLQEGGPSILKVSPGEEIVGYLWKARQEAIARLEKERRAITKSMLTQES